LDSIALRFQTASPKRRLALIFIVIQLGLIAIGTEENALNPVRELIAANVARLALNKISKTTPCKETGGRRHGSRTPQKHFDTSGKPAAQLHHRAI
jgi:hypothetical protein